MSTGNKALDAFISRVESLRSLNEDVATEAAPEVLEQIQKTTSAGQTPSGEAWPEKQEGGKALAGAADAITSRAQGTKVIVSVGPPWAYHNFGAGGSSQTKRAKSERKARAAHAAASGTKSKFHAPRRQIIPDVNEPIPERIKAVVVEAARAVFSRKTEGR